MGRGDALLRVELQVSAKSGALVDEAFDELALHAALNSAGRGDEYVSACTVCEVSYT